MLQEELLDLLLMNSGENMGFKIILLVNDSNNFARSSCFIFIAVILLKMSDEQRPSFKPRGDYTGHTDQCALSPLFSCSLCYLRKTEFPIIIECSGKIFGFKAGICLIEQI